MLSATNFASSSGFFTSAMLICAGTPAILDTALRNFSTSSPFLPITIPGRAVWIVTRMLFAGRSIVIRDTEAFANSLFKNLRTLKSPSKLSAKSCVFANQVEFQGLTIPRRIPLGCTF